DVDDAQDAQDERRPADDLPARGTVVLGVAQRAPPQVEEPERDGPGDLADGPGGGGADEIHGAAGGLPPDRAGHHHGQAQEREADPVATVGGIEVPGAVPDAARRGADAVGDAEPGGADTATQRAEAPGDGAWAVADRAGRG